MHGVDRHRGAIRTQGGDWDVGEPDSLFDQGAGAVVLGQQVAGLSRNPACPSRSLPGRRGLQLTDLLEIGLPRSPEKIILFTQPLYDGFDV